MMSILTECLLEMERCMIWGVLNLGWEDLYLEGFGVKGRAVRECTTFLQRSENTKFTFVDYRTERLRCGT